MTRVVSIGECMVELAPAGAPGTFAMSYAGDTFNTAWYLAKLAPGWQVDFATAIGTDKISDAFMGFAAEAGIGTGHIMRHADRHMGLYMIELEKGERSFHYWRETSAARMLAKDPDALAEALSGSDIIFFSGITLAILTEDDREELFDAISDAQASGAIVVFDPNLRDRLWTDLEEMRGAIMEAALSSEIVLASFDEEARHFGDADPSATVARYLSAGATSVVVKNGAGPIHYSCGGVAGMHVPDAVDAVVDTTAAGDSFNAGFLANLIAGDAPADAIEAASQLSGEVIQAHGALVSVPAARLSGKA